MKPDNLSLAIEQAATANGYDSCGIISIDDMAGFKKYYQQRLQEIPSSEMFYQAVGDLSGSTKRFPWAKSIIIVLFL